MTREQFIKFNKSMESHQVKISQYSQLVTLLDSDNPYFKYPVVGVIHVYEQTTTLGVNGAVFHQLQGDGSLSAPAVVRNPIFTNKVKHPVC